MNNKITLSTLFLALLLCGSPHLMAQKAADKLLTYKDAAYQNPNIFPQRLRNITWRANSKAYVQQHDKAFVQTFVGTKSEPTVLFDLEALNTVLKAHGEDAYKRLPYIKAWQNDAFVLQRADRVLKVNMNNKQVETLNSWQGAAAHKDFSVNYDMAFTRANNLYVAQQGTTIQITHDSADSQVVNGQTAHRNEFGISKGIFWSPKANYIAYYRKDESAVGDYPLVDIEAREAAEASIKYPMAGMDNEVVKLRIYNMKTQQTVELQTGDSIDQYLTAVSWGPQEKYMYVGLLNRAQNHLSMRQYKVADGSYVRTLFEERADTWVEPENPLFFLPNSAERFVWLSERDGWMHAYLYNTKGQLIKQLTKGEWQINELFGFSPDAKQMFFTATKESPIQKQVYSVSLSNTKIKKLTKAHGTHTAIFSPNKQFFIDSYASTDMARAYELRTAHGKKIETLLEDANPLKDYKLGKMSIGTLTNEDGRPLYYRLIKPIDFDSTKTYPVFFYLYGGPHAQLVTDSWMGGASMFMQLMAQKGYIVFTIDNRGTPNRGFAFENAIHRQLGKLEMKDQLVGVDYLLSLPYVDADRMGIQGWSYGGFMTINMMLENPGVFKAGVAGGPVIDWKWYEIMYGERYMDRPQENPEGYKSCSLLPKAKNLTDHLLIIQGAMDGTVVWQHSQSMVRQFIKDGIQVDYFVYPKAEHNVRGIDRAHLFEKMYLYINNNITNN